MEYLPARKNAELSGAFSSRRSKPSHRRSFDVGQRDYCSTGIHLFIGRIAHRQNLEREDDLPAAEGIVAVDGQRVVVQPGHDEAARLSLVVLHEDASADLPILLGNVLDSIR